MADARHRETVMRVDFIFSATPYERQAIDRAVLVTLAGVPVPFASEEDLIVHKLFAGRPRDDEDVVGVVRRERRNERSGPLVTNQRGRITNTAISRAVVIP